MKKVNDSWESSSIDVPQAISKILNEELTKEMLKSLGILSRNEKRKKSINKILNDISRTNKK